MAFPDVLALDFDGVLCDGLREYFQVSWRTYQQLWPEDASPEPPAGLAEQFYTVRPVVETGWEMPIVVRSLRLGATPEQLLADWPTERDRRIAEEQRDRAQLSSTLDGLRDQWIREDLRGWLDLHRFYPGTIERVQEAIANGTQVFIITTKEARFAQQLLQRAGLRLDAALIFGKGVKRPKAETLRILRDRAIAETGQSPRIWFVEDRLETLLKIAPASDLATVELFLADWGYNTPAARSQAAASDRLNLITLSQFAQDWPTWLQADTLTAH